MAHRVRISGDFPKSGAYTGGGYAQEISTNDDPNRYVEMELLAPIRKLAVGTTSRFVTHGSLPHRR